MIGPELLQHFHLLIRSQHPVLCGFIEISDQKQKKTKKNKKKGTNAAQKMAQNPRKNCLCQDERSVFSLQEETAPRAEVGVAN